MTLCSAKLIAVTQPVEGATAASSPEEVISYAARVSNPSNQENFDTAEGLLRYCMRNAHWSVFAMADATVEVEVPRDISRQAIRHKSFDFQEFSQRYSDEFTFVPRDIRRQDTKNRQNSVDDFSDDDKEEFKDDCLEVALFALDRYRKWQARGGAKECCRVFLPEGLTVSRFYMKGSLRSWLHYLDVREHVSTQLEHRQLANAIREAITPVFPTVLKMVTID